MESRVHLGYLLRHHASLMLFHIVEKKKRSRPMSPKAQLEHDKRVRREIANSNERRRMQCINAGFQSLRALMPQLNGEKLSKAAILQHTTEYIANMEQEKNKLVAQNEQLKRMVLEMGRERDIERQNESPPPKRKKRDTESSDEGISMGGSASDSSEDLQTTEDLQREMLELRQQLNHERLLRVMLEDRTRSLEAQLYHPQHHSHVPTLVHTQMNLKVAESHVGKSTCNVQEVSAHEDRALGEPHYHHPAPPRRNLENLVEAIRQIEGDRALGDDHKFYSERHATLTSEESEKESSVSDQEESKSEGSGRDSPSPLGLCAHRVAAVAVSASASALTTTTAETGSATTIHASYSEKYPIASHLLHRPSYSQYYRPGVIVHKS